MNKDNSRVPVAILCCFLIAFITQGILKLSGIFIFEKALNWQIFLVIDSNLFLQTIYYSLMVIIIVYCLSFSLTDKIYSNKWYHYVIIIVPSIFITFIRWINTFPYELEIILDFVLYVLIPFIVNLTSDKERKLFKTNLFTIILTLSIQIGLYFCYLGLTYWSSILSSICITSDMVIISSSTNFLIQFEKYIGLITFMLGMNMFIRRVKNMIKPIDIASEEAKIKEIEELEKKGK